MIGIYKWLKITYITFDEIQNTKNIDKFMCSYVLIHSLYQFKVEKELIQNQEIM